MKRKKIFERIFKLSNIQMKITANPLNKRYV